MTLSRREMLKLGGLGAVGAAGLGSIGSLPFGGTVLAREASALAERDFPAPFEMAFRQPPVLRPTHWEYDDAARLVRQYYHVTARETTVRILPRLTTRMWGYNGLVPGPTIKVDRGVQTVLRVRNKLPAQHPLFGHDFGTSTHLHGSASLPEYDGYANDITPPGFYKDYQFPNFQAARTIWYHDHAVHYTAQNAYSGLFAQYHIHDPVEQELLPQGEFDVPLTVTDALFSADGELSYDDESHSGLYGDVILVNGRPWPAMKVQRRVYRFRILTAAASRSFRFRLDGGDPMHLVCTDGGLMPAAQTVTQWRQGSGERYEVLIDFRRYRGGQRVVLENLSNDNNRDYDHTGKVMAFDVLDDGFGAGEVDRSDPTWNRLPTELAPSHVMGLTAASALRTRHLEMGRTGGEWTINDQTWSGVVDSNYQRVVADPDLGDVEVWDIENKSGGWFHPTHIHLVDFRILSRNGRPPEAWEQGPKDVAYIGENETVRVVARYGDPDRPETRGRYMVHCHNLVHEDHDMMNQFAVGWKPGQPDTHNPMTADPCQWDDLPEERGVAPGRPEPPEVDEVGRDWVELEWDEPDDDGDDDIVGYRIRGFAAGNKLIDITIGDRRKHTVTGLSGDLAYTFTVAGLNRMGTGPQSPRSLAVSALGPPDAPTAPAIGRARAETRAAIVTWRAPRSAGAITGYQVRVLHRRTRRQVGRIRLAGADERSLVVRRLGYGRRYTFQVRAVGVAGPGPYSARSNQVRTPRPDRRRPRVLRRTRRPRPGARNVRRRRNVTARFNEPVTRVSPRTVRLRRADGGRVRARVRYNRRTRRVSVNPRHSFSPNERYVVRFTRGIRDEAGNRLRPKRWRFMSGRRH